MENLTHPFRVCHVKQRPRQRTEPVTSMSFPHSTCPCTCQRPDTGRTANDQWFHSDVCVWDSLGWWDFRGGGGPRQRTEQFGPPAFPEVTGIWHLRYCLMPEEWPVSSLYSSRVLCRTQLWAVHKYTCVHVRKCKYGERSQMRCEPQLRPPACLDRVSECQWGSHIMGALPLEPQCCFHRSSIITPPPQRRCRNTACFHGHQKTLWDVCSAGSPLVPK